MRSAAPQHHLVVDRRDGSVPQREERSIDRRQDRRSRHDELRLQDADHLCAFLRRMLGAHHEPHIAVENVDPGQIAHKHVADGARLVDWPSIPNAPKPETSQNTSSLVLVAPLGRGVRVGYGNRARFRQIDPEFSTVVTCTNAYTFEINRSSNGSYTYVSAVITTSLSIVMPHGLAVYFPKLIHLPGVNSSGLLVPDVLDATGVPVQRRRNTRDRSLRRPRGPSQHLHQARRLPAISCSRSCRMSSPTVTVSVRTPHRSPFVTTRVRSRTQKPLREIGFSSCLTFDRAREFRVPLRDLGLESAA